MTLLKAFAFAFQSLVIKIFFPLFPLIAFDFYPWFLTSHGNDLFLLLRKKNRFVAKEKKN